MSEQQPTNDPIHLDTDCVVIGQTEDPTININCTDRDTTTQVKTYTEAQPGGVVFVSTEPQHALIKIPTWENLVITQEVNTDQFLSNAEGKRQFLGRLLVEIAQLSLEQAIKIKTLELSYETSVVKTMVMVRGQPQIDISDEDAVNTEAQKLVVVAKAELIYVVIRREDTTTPIQVQ